MFSVYMNCLLVRLLSFQYVKLFTVALNIELKYFFLLSKYL